MSTTQQNTDASAPQDVGNRAGEASRSTQFVPSVLVLEDDRNYRRAVKRVLERAGLGVLTARDEQEAAAHFETSDRIDLLLADVILPDGDGREIAGRFATQHPHLKVLFMSAYEEDELESFGASIEGDYISKEAGELRLAEVVSRTLRMGR